MNETRQPIEVQPSEERKCLGGHDFSEHQLVVPAAIKEIAADIGTTLDLLLTVENGPKYAEVYPVLKMIIQRLNGSEPG